jgi:hypothetical protein
MKTNRKIYLCGSTFNDSTLIAKSLLIVNQVQFPEEDYANLRAIFDRIVHKQAENIVFKRKPE